MKYIVYCEINLEPDDLDDLIFLLRQNKYLDLKGTHAVIIYDNDNNKIKVLRDNNEWKP